MKAFLDTSVLVPVFFGDHIHHEASLRLFAGMTQAMGCCASHSLVEVYSTLTRMPGRHRVSAEQALLFLGDVRERLSLISLDGEECAHALEAAAQLGVVGGSVYDAMLAHAALKAKTTRIFTWNLRHYNLLGPSVTSLLATP